jgi:hypothetical protein
MKWSVLKRAIEDALAEAGETDADIHLIDLGIGGVPADDHPEVRWNAAGGLEII